MSAVPDDLMDVMWARFAKMPSSNAGDYARCAWEWFRAHPHAVRPSAGDAGNVSLYHEECGTAHRSGECPNPSPPSWRWCGVCGIKVPPEHFHDEEGRAATTESVDAYYQREAEDIDTANEELQGMVQRARSIISDAYFRAGVNTYETRREIARAWLQEADWGHGVTAATDDKGDNPLTTPDPDCSCEHLTGTPFAHDEDCPLWGGEGSKWAPHDASAGLRHRVECALCDWYMASDHTDVLLAAFQEHVASHGASDALKNVTHDLRLALSLLREASDVAFDKHWEERVQAFLARLSPSNSTDQ